MIFFFYRVLGFCIEGSRKLLVYEYISNGSLADLLFKAKKRPLWKERVRITLEVARGVFFLHQECEVHIIHCNLKPQNIFMDDTWTAKISDFGLRGYLCRLKREFQWALKGQVSTLHLNGRKIP